MVRVGGVGDPSVSMEPVEGARPSLLPPEMRVPDREGVSVRSVIGATFRLGFVLSVGVGAVALAPVTLPAVLGYGAGYLFAGGLFAAADKSITPLTDSTLELFAMASPAIVMPLEDTMQIGMGFIEMLQAATRALTEKKRLEELHQ